MQNNTLPLIRAIFNQSDQMVFYIRDNGKIVRVCVDKTEFTSPTSVADFEDYEIIDFGHTARFGPYEASAEAILEYKRS